MEDEGCGIVIIIIAILIAGICLLTALFSTISLLYASFFRLLISSNVPVGLLVVVAALVGVAIGNYRTFKSVNRKTTALLSSIGIVALAFMLAFLTFQEVASRHKAIRQVAQFRQKIVGCWMGQFGTLTFAQMIFSADGSVLVNAPEGRAQAGQGQQTRWREVFRGTWDREANIVTLVSASENTTETYKATLNINESNDSLTGDFANATRSKVGRITLERCFD